MRDQFFQSSQDDHKTPEAKAQEHMRKPLPKRFYKSVDIARNDNQFIVRLDGKPLKTPARNEFALPGDAGALIVAQEWERQKEVIDPNDMPLTRLVNTALDGVASEPQAVLEDILRFASNDLILYRASYPQNLVDAQCESWDPILDWITEETGSHFETGEGILHIEQDKEAIRCFSLALGTFAEPLKLACLHTMTTITGSAMIAFALAKRKLELEEAWAAAHVDEQHNRQVWGEDYEAAKRQENRFGDMQAAHALLISIS